MGLSARGELNFKAELTLPRGQRLYFFLSFNSDGVSLHRRHKRTDLCPLGRL